MKNESKRIPRGAMKLVGANEHGDVVMRDKRGNLHPFTKIKDGEPISEEQADAPLGTFVSAGKDSFRFQKSRDLRHKGPARVASNKYRDEWTRIFGEKTRGGAPN